MHKKYLRSCSGVLLMLAACSSAPETAPRGRRAAIARAGRARRDRREQRSARVAAGSGGDRRRPRVLRFRPLRHHVLRRSRSCTRQAEWLRRYPNVTVTIEGHCDERGTREYNLALGERRAQAVKNVLVALGIPGEPDLDDQLWQGAAGGCRVDRRGLCAEPPRGHDRQLRRESRARYRLAQSTRRTRGRPFFALNGP